MANSQARNQRRSYELWLKRTNPTAYKEWKSQSHTRGKMIFEQNVEAARNAEVERLEKLQTEKIVAMKAEGRSEEEIDRYIGIWVKTLKLWATGEKPLNWKEATREYERELEESKTK
jgi:hypothetical protein